MSKIEEASVKQAAKISGLSRGQIYNLVRDNKIKFRKPNFELYIDVKSLLEYVGRPR